MFRPGGGDCLHYELCLPSALLLWVRLLYGALVAQRAAGDRPGEGRPL